MDKKEDKELVETLIEEQETKKSEVIVVGQFTMQNLYREILQNPITASILVAFLEGQGLTLDDVVPNGFALTYTKK